MADFRSPAGRRRLLVLMGALLAAPIPAAEDPLLAESRDIARDFGDRLRAALQAAMVEGGPAGAVDICKEAAPQIASELSRTTGAQVVRTSLRVRNPRNLAAAWQAEVLRSFEAQAAAGASAAPEYFERLGDGEVRYMKAIPAAGLCLACHGTALSEDVRQMLGELYPHDRAVGYEPGDVRGAFSIVWPAERKED